MRACWLSRHPMTAQQLADLEKEVGEPVEVTTINQTWQATSDREADAAANCMSAKELMRGYDMICGVFPPVALVAFLRVSGGCIDLWTPVSVQHAEMRADGDSHIAFSHARWEFISVG